MKNKGILILGSISLVIVFTIIGFLIAPNSILSLITPNISLKEENFDGIYLKGNINKLNADKISEDILNPNLYYLSNGIRVITDENKNIRNIAITHDTDANVKTSRGISVGDSLVDVKKY